MIHLVCPNPALDRTVLLSQFKEDVVNRPSQVHENAGGKSLELREGRRARKFLHSYNVRWQNGRIYSTIK